MQKAEFGAHLLMNFINERSQGGNDEPGATWPSTGSEGQSAAAPASWETGASQDTLIPADRRG
jgi:hypothetical protein